MLIHVIVYENTFSDFKTICQIFNNHNMCSKPVKADAATPDLNDW